MLPLGDTWADNNDEQEEEAGGVNVCCEEIADLTECLFSTLSTAEMVMTQTIARQVRNPATEERELVLLESESDLSLQNVEPGPAKDLLQIDLQLIAAMQSSLEDSKFAKYMDHKNRKFDAVQLYKELGNEARQMKYWADKLANNSDGRSMTSETQAAMMLNLTNIARTFGKSPFASRPRSVRSPAIIRSFSYTELQLLIVLKRLQLQVSDPRKPANTSITTCRPCCNNVQETFQN